MEMPARPLPDLSQSGSAFWTGGARGELRIGWCPACRRHLHPARETCDGCGGAELEFTPIDGKATLLSFTVNHQPWLSGVPVPYVIGIVAPNAAPRVHLTTNIVDCAPERLAIGMPVAVRFERCDDVWLPVFAPADGPPAPVDIRPPAPAIRPRGAAEKFERRSAITGVGMSQLGRRLARSEGLLAVDACRAAIGDAGLRIEDIDGIAAYPGSEGLPGISRGGVRGLEQALGIRPTWHCGAQEVAGQLGVVVEAMLAVAAGLCRHVLCFTSFSDRRRPSLEGPAAGRVSGELAWQLPYGAASPANWIALCASHYLARYGVGREALGWIAVSARRHAAGNPRAIYRDSLGLDDYFAARPVSTPFGLFDCDVPCSGAAAVVVSERGAARDLAHLPVCVEAVGTAMAESQTWDQGTLTHQMNVFGPAAHLWSRSEFKAADVDLACLYDGFTFNALSWLEALGFCGIGEGGDFVAGGGRIGPGGDLPLNPHGGHLAEGRTQGWGNLVEAVAQLRGRAAGRQVAGAQLAVVSSGGGIPAGCMLLSRGS